MPSNVDCEVGGAWNNYVTACLNDKQNKTVKGQIQERPSIARKNAQ